MIQRIAIAAVITASLLISACSVPESLDKGVSSGLIVKMSLEELIANADWIVVGVITAGESRWDADHTYIYTYYTISVKEWVKGSPEQNVLVIKVPGGEVELQSQWVEDVASFQEGEEVLGFLRRNDDGTGDVVGGFQGKYTVEHGEVVNSDLPLQELISRIKALDNK